MTDWCSRLGWTEKCHGLSQMIQVSSKLVQMLQHPYGFQSSDIFECSVSHDDFLQLYKGGDKKAHDRGIYQIGREMKDERRDERLEKFRNCRKKCWTAALSASKQKRL